MKDKTYNLITILGATATGKTNLASQLAYLLDSEIISADSRQVYKEMDIGTGKDLKDYQVKNKNIPYHLINIAEAGEKYNIFEYQKDFLKIYKNLQKENKTPILCGGTGLYLEAVLKGYKLIHVPINETLRKELNEKDLSELRNIIHSLKKEHNVSDSDTKKRAIRSIEIAKYYHEHQEIDFSYPEINSLLIGIKFDRDTRRKRITERLEQRLKEGMIEEVELLLQKGIKSENLIYYGLEYKFLTLFVLGQISYNEMFNKLNIAIHQFSKRQMTWFRKMEKNGFKIHWLDGHLTLDEKIKRVFYFLNN